MKEYFYNYDSENDEYVRVEVLVPYLFVQAEQESTLFTDIKDKNSTITASHKNTIITTNDRAVIDINYEPMLNIFQTNKDTINNELVIAYVQGA